MLKAWRCISLDDKWQIGTYWAGSLWSLLFFTFTPGLLREGLLEWGIAITGFAPLLGALLGTAGILTRRHLSLELPGIVAVLAGPFSYFAIQLPIVIGSPEGIDRIHLLGLSAWIMIALGRRAHFLFLSFMNALVPPLSPELRAAIRSRKLARKVAAQHARKAHR